MRLTYPAAAWLAGVAFLFVSCSRNSSKHIPEAGIAPPTPVALDITHYQDVSLTNQDSDRILSEANSVLSNSRGRGNVSCPVGLTRHNPVTQFTAGSGIIRGSGDYTQVCSQPGYIHVVTQILWCKSFILLGTVLGCSDQSGTCMVVTRIVPEAGHDYEGILWAHEYGHTKNLFHRNDPDAVMNYVVTPDHRNVNQPECDAYHGQYLTITEISNASPALGVADFVRQEFIHGVPFDQAQKYNSDHDLQQLTAMLHDPAFEPYWNNVAAVLGMIGTEVAARQLEKFIQEGSGPLTKQTALAKNTAVLALGVSLAKTKSNAVLKFLVLHAHPSGWSLKRTSPNIESLSKPDATLAATAILALGLSGTAKAHQALTNFVARTKAEDSASATSLKSALGESLDQNAKVRDLGLARYMMALQPKSH